MKSHSLFVQALLLCLFAAFAGGISVADDWPTFRHDGARSGYTDETLPASLTLEWVHKPLYGPEPAWTDPHKERPRNRFDDTFQVAVAGDTAYYASSADNQVYALDTATGEVRWSAFTEGPIRLAPTVWEDKVYVGSDDGFAYCFRAKDGSLVWKVRGAFRDTKVIGNDEMISLWPVRTGVLVDNGIAYFGAGVFPHEGLFICAVNAEDGAVLWRNDSVGDDGPNLEFGGISPQGYILASADALFVPSGRAMPAAFSRTGGDLLYYCNAGKAGGTWALVAGNEVVAGQDQKQSYDEQTGGQSGAGPYTWFPALQLVVAKDWSYMVTDTEVAALDQRAGKLAEPWRNTVTAEFMGLQQQTWMKMVANAQKKDPEAERQIAEMQSRLDILKNQQQHIHEAMYRWRQPCNAQNALIVAGKTLFVGGDNEVFAVDAITGKTTWRGEVDGKASGLAAANGRLYVSSDKGPIYAFGQGSGAAPKTVAATPSVSPYPVDQTQQFQDAAARILAQSGVTKGYCLVYGCGTGQLALELARKTGPELKIIGVDSDPATVKTARDALARAGLYGSRVVIDQADLAALPYSDYFANLVVVAPSSAASSAPAPSFQELFRLLKPCGGVAVVSSNDSAANAQSLRAWAGNAGQVTEEEGGWLKLVRAPLEGAGEWTHLYADAANTACAQDQYVKGALGVLWFGGPGSENMVDRHARVSAPVSKDGRFFVQGEEIVLAYDAYNGVPLWTKEIPGSTRVRVDSDMNNIVLGDGGVYVAAHNKCLRLDPATGETLATYKVPAPTDHSVRRWGYVACVGDTLLGSSALAFRKDYGASWKELLNEDGTAWRNPDQLPTTIQGFQKPDANAFWSFQQHGLMWDGAGDWPSWGSVSSPEGAVTKRIMASDVVFATDVVTGNALWSYAGQVAHPAIAVSNDTVFLADCRVTDAHKQTAMAEKQALIAKGVWKEGIEAERNPNNTDVRRVVALDLKTGQKRWERIIDLTGCGGDRMGLAYHDGVLVFFGCFSNHDQELFRKGLLEWRRITAVSAGDGKDMWSRPLNYLRRPVIVNDTILIEPRACDLRTGEIRTRSHPLTGATEEWEFVRPGHCCSITTASPHMFFLRGNHLWYYDMERDQGMLSFGAIRPGCWVNVIPSNGLVLFPEAAAGCTCSYPIRSTVALKPQEDYRTWSIAVQHGKMTPVRHMALNFGAPGDWRGDDGTLWLSYPHPPGNPFLQYGIDFKLEEEGLPGALVRDRNFQGASIAGTDKPYLFGSYALGFTRFTLPLLDEGQAPRTYTVRLYFAETEGAAPGQRVFDVKLQGKTVLDGFDIAKAAGGADKAIVKEFGPIAVTDRLEVELVPQTPAPAPEQMPLINAVEVKTVEAA